MSFLVRKINKAKWFQINITESDDVSADALTNDLKTTNNSLSVWRINELGELNEAILAIVSNLDHLETIDVVLFSTELVESLQLDTTTTPGLTPVEDLKDKHVDIANLNYSKLGMISRAIVADLRQSMTHRFTKGQLKTILLEAIQGNRISIELLNEGISKKLG
jgi:hypothetical protein